MTQPDDQVYAAAVVAYDEALNATLHNPPGMVLGPEGRLALAESPAMRAAINTAYAAGRRDAAADMRAWADQNLHPAGRWRALVHRAAKAAEPAQPELGKLIAVSMQAHGERLIDEAVMGGTSCPGEPHLGHQDITQPCPLFSTRTCRNCGGLINLDRRHLRGGWTHVGDWQGVRCRGDLTGAEPAATP